MASMKLKIFAAMFGAVLLGAGCISTVNERSTPGIPLVRDTVQGHYERPLEQVYGAAVDVIKFNGSLVNESTLHDQTNQVKTIEGRVNQSKVWVRVEAISPKITEVSVQARTSGGRSDLDLTHEVEKQIALKLSER